MAVEEAPSSARAAPRGVRAQFLAFAAVGAVGYLVDSAITYLCARYLRLSPELARPPGFVTATVVNFLLNRAIAFRHSKAPRGRAFVRYFLVASAGLAVNYAVYSACVLLAPCAGIATTPAILPFFILVGVGFSMVGTFLGLRHFAFRG